MSVELSEEIKLAERCSLVTSTFPQPHILYALRSMLSKWFYIFVSKMNGYDNRSNVIEIYLKIAPMIRHPNRIR